MYILIILLFYKSNIVSRKRWIRDNEHKTWLLFILYYICILSIFCNHDFYGYYTIIKFSPLGDNSHLEPPYVAIAEFFDRNYLLFRMTVWGAALIFFCIGAKEAKISIYHSLFILASCFFVTFAYGRVSLAMSMCFCGYILYYQNKSKNLLKASIGIIIFICAFYFHKSIVFAMFMSILMTYIPINKITIWLAIVSVPVLFFFTKTGFFHIITHGGVLNDDTADLAVMYSELERQQSNLYGMIGELLDYGLYYITAYLGIKALFINHKQNQVSILSFNLFKISLGLIFIGTCFFFFGLANKVFAYRILYMSMIPLTYCIVRFYKDGVITKRQLKYLVYWGIANSLFYTLYMVYKQI